LSANFASAFDYAKANSAGAIRRALGPRFHDGQQRPRDQIARRLLGHSVGCFLEEVYKFVVIEPHPFKAKSE
jgi:hypothetical protein